MSYVINSKSLHVDTIITNVTYTLSNKSSITVDVAHFRPSTIDDIRTNILNRELSEEASILALASVSEVFNSF